MDTGKKNLDGATTSEDGGRGKKRKEAAATREGNGEIIESDLLVGRGTTFTHRKQKGLISFPTFPQARRYFPNSSS